MKNVRQFCPICNSYLKSCNGTLGKPNKYNVVSNRYCISYLCENCVFYGLTEKYLGLHHFGYYLLEDFYFNNNYQCSIEYYDNNTLIRFSKFQYSNGWRQSFRVSFCNFLNTDNKFLKLDTVKTFCNLIIVTNNINQDFDSTIEFDSTSSAYKLPDKEVLKHIDDIENLINN